MNGKTRKFGAFKLDWLIDARVNSGSDFAALNESCDTTRLAYDIDPALGEAFVENLKLAPGFDLYRAVHRLEKADRGQMIPLIDISAELPEPVLSMQIWLSGMCCHQEYWRGRQQASVDIVARPGHDTFRILRSWDCRVLVEGGGTSEMRSVLVSFSTLDRLLGTAERGQLLEKLGLHDDQPTVVLPMPAHVSQPLCEALSERYSGPMRRLFAQARALDYLGRVFSFLDQEHGASHRRHSVKIRELRDYLLRLEGRLPTLEQIAKDFGLSAKQLNAEFSAEFGQSIFAFVTNHRLEQAYAALQGSHLPMKVIAERLGYSHVNHFITAFKRKYGYPPGSLRTGKRH
jgi:AraC-like DNA-binding protein